MAVFVQTQINDIKGFIRIRRFFDEGSSFLNRFDGIEKKIESCILRIFVLLCISMKVLFVFNRDRVSR